MLQQRARSQWLSKGKNCAMLNTRELVNMFLIYPIQIKWVSVIPASVVNLNLRPPSWLWWIKLLEMIWNWSLSPITFLINFPNVFRSIMGLKDFSELYDVLLGFEITIVIEFLKWLGQYPISKHALAIAMMFFKHILSLMMHLRYPHKSLSGPDVDVLLYLTIALVNSSLENDIHGGEEYESNLFSMLSSIWWNWAVLNEEWRACHRSSKSKQGWPLYLIISMAGSLCLLTQLISSQGLCFLLAISWILRSKKDYFVFLTVFQKAF